MTPTVVVITCKPSNGNSTAWEQDCVLTRLLSNQCTGGSQKHRPVLEVLDHSRQEPKQLKCAWETEEEVGTSVEYVEEETVLQPDPNILVNWWQSGDARHLFAPCDVLYDSNCYVKEIVMERIELLETVNCAS